jgi:hypothetical protein
MPLFCGNLMTPEPHHHKSRDRGTLYRIDRFLKQAAISLICAGICIPALQVPKSAVICAVLPKKYSPAPGSHVSDFDRLSLMKTAGRL